MEALGKLSEFNWVTYCVYPANEEADRLAEEGATGIPDRCYTLHCRQKAQETLGTGASGHVGRLHCLPPI